MIFEDSQIEHRWDVVASIEGELPEADEVGHDATQTRIVEGCVVRQVKGEQVRAWHRQTLNVWKDYCSSSRIFKQSWDSARCEIIMLNEIWKIAWILEKSSIEFVCYKFHKTNPVKCMPLCWWLQPCWGVASCRAAWQRALARCCCSLRTTTDSVLPVWNNKQFEGVYLL